MPLQPGTILENRYRVDSLLGQGGMGAVYRAWHERLAIWVALKENTLSTPEAHDQFQHEARILARLHHFNLPKVIDHFVTTDGAQYLVMTFIEGVNLAELLAARGKQFPGDAMVWLGQVCDALTYLHSHNPPIIHRDIKPQNIKITPDGHVFLVDFGLSKVGSIFQSTASGALGATPGYAPLEQYGIAHTDQRSDVYALTATLYAMLTGETPPESVKRAVGTAALTPPRAMNLTVSPALERALLHGLETQPTDRPASVATLRQEVEAALAPPKPEPRPQLAQPNWGAPQPSPVPKPAPAPAAPSRGLPRWASVGAVAVALVLLVLGVAPLGRSGQPAATVVVDKPTATPTAEGTVKPRATMAVAATSLSSKGTGMPTVLPTSTDTPTLVDAPVPSATPTALPDAVVIATTANVRTGPGTTYDRLGAYPQDTAVKIMGKNASGDWLQVMMADGKSGWVAKTLLRVNIALDQIEVSAVPPTPTAIAVTTPVATKIAIPDTIGRAPSVSPDGSLVSVTSNDKAELQIYRTGDWSAPTTVCRIDSVFGYGGLSFGTEGSWSPDGSMVAIMGYTPVGTGIYLCRISDGLVSIFGIDPKGNSNNFLVEWSKSDGLIYFWSASGPNQGRFFSLYKAAPGGDAPIVVKSCPAAKPGERANIC